MLSIIFNWIYILFTSFLIGYAFLQLVKRLLCYDIQSISGVIAAGLVIATVYAQLFSLFYKVGAAANVLMLLVCAAVLLAWNKEIVRFLGRSTGQTTKITKILILVLILIWAYCTSRGYMHYDSDLYHAQSIRWIEEYGVVKGLGNIHIRFSYNSSFFALSALYTMKFMGGQSLHAVNGFIALILSIEVLKLKDIIKIKQIRLSDFARLGAFYYLTVIYSDITSPASDYAIMCVVFYIIIKWLVQLETDSESIVPFALICVGGVYAVSLKLTSGLVLLLVLKPVYMLVKKKRWRDIALYIIMGLVVILPWIARTVIISGYLLYPFPALDILNVDWKITSEAAALDAAEIKTWGRGLNNAALVNLSVKEWFQNWLMTTLPTIGKLLIAADILCIIIFIILLMHFIYRLISGKNKTGLYKNYSENLLVLFTIAVSYMFWQFSAPLLRYGYAYVLLMVLLTAGILVQWIDVYFGLRGKQVIYRVSVVFVILFTTIKFVSLMRYSYSESNKPYYLKQQDYGSYALDSFEVNGILFYYPQSGDQVGYEPFPAIPCKINIALRGEDISDGFKCVY